MTTFQAQFQQEPQFFVIGMEILVDSVLEERMALLGGNDSDSDFSLGSRCSRKDLYDSDSDSSYEESDVSSQHSVDSISTCDSGDDDASLPPATVLVANARTQIPAALSSLLKDISFDEEDDNSDDDASLPHDHNPSEEGRENLQTSLRSSKSDSNLLLSMRGGRQGASLRRKGSKTKLMDHEDAFSNNRLTLKNIAFQNLTQTRRRTTHGVGA